jgi:hypothetical protein
MRDKRIFRGIIAVLVVIMGSCSDKKTVEEFDYKQTVVAEEGTATEGSTDESATGEVTHITDLSGILSYYPDYQKWSVRYTIPGTIDSVNLYLIKDGMSDLSTNTSIDVLFSGDSFPSAFKSPLGGLTIYYITNFKYKQI